MTLDDLLQRFFFIVGDNPDNPREFDRDRAIDLMNEGCRQFRRTVEDEWYRQDVPVVAGTHTYDLPEINVRVQRIAFDDYTMRPRTVQELVALDAKWETRTGPHPFDWTTQGVAHNEFRVYPEPTATSTQSINQTGEYGALVRWVEDGTNATYSAEYGVVVRVEGSDLGGPFSSEYGEVGKFNQSRVKQCTVWGTRKIAEMDNTDSEVPIKNAYEKAGLWYALWHTYEEEHEHHNKLLASFYRDKFNDEVEKGRQRAHTPLPWIVHKLGQKTSRVSSRSFLPFSPDMSVPGLGNISIGWPKKGYWS